MSKDDVTLRDLYKPTELSALSKLRALIEDLYHGDIGTAYWGPKFYAVKNSDRRLIFEPSGPWSDVIPFLLVQAAVQSLLTIPDDRVSVVHHPDDSIEIRFYPQQADAGTFYLKPTDMRRWEAREAEKEELIERQRKAAYARRFKKQDTIL